MSDVSLNFNFILVGPKGCGKSSTGNTILAKFPGHPFFNVGDSFNDGTIRIKIVPMGTDYVASDCQGFGDLSGDREQFGDLPLYVNFKSNEVKEKLIDRKFKFLFCIKFDAAHIPNTYFRQGLEQFVKVFGSEGVHSLVLIVIQKANALCLDEFKPKLETTDGYMYLKEKNNNEDIPFVLWDNHLSSYPNQIKNLSERASKVKDLLFDEKRFEVLDRHIDFLYSERDRNRIERENQQIQEARLEEERQRQRLQEERDRVQADLDQLRNNPPAPRGFWERLMNLFN